MYVLKREVLYCTASFVSVVATCELPVPVRYVCIVDKVEQFLKERESSRAFVRKHIVCSVTIALIMRYRLAIDRGETMRRTTRECCPE